MEVKDTYVADVSRYSGPLREAAREADRFGNKNDQAALAARRMGLAAKEAADKAAKAQKNAADAAEKLAKGEIKAEESERLAAKAANELERASIKAAEAQRAAGRAAENTAQQYRQEARDAELAAAAEHLGALKAAGAVKQHNAEVLRLRKEMPELGKDGSKAFTLMGSASRSFGSALDGATSSMSELSGVGRAVPGLIAVGLQALPFLATAAGGAITLGLGGALSALAIKAQSSNAEVQKSFSDLRKHATSEIRQISAPFHDTLLNISKDARMAFDSMEPSLQGAFAKMAPAISGFASDFAGSLEELNPAIDSIGTAFSRVLNTLGPQMPAIMHNMATGVQAVTDAVAKNPQALSDMANAIGYVVRGTGDAIGTLIRFEHQINATAKSANAFAAGPLGWAALGAYKVKKAIDGSTSSLKIGEGTFQSFDAQAVQTAQSTGHLATTMQMAKLAANEMSAAFAAASGKTLSEREALAQYRQAITSMTQALKDNGHAHGFASQKGAQNEQALDGMAVAAQKAAQAMRDDGKGAKEVSTFLEGARQRIIAAAEKMHYSASAAKSLADKLLGVTHAANSIPSGKRINLHDNAMTARQHIAALQASINQLHGRTVTIDYIERVHRTLQAERARADGGIDFYADGGMRRDLQPFIAAQPTVLFGETETGGEAYIPLGQSKRQRSTDLLGQVADMFGLELVKPLADGMLEKYAKGKVGIGKKEQQQIARLHAAQARVDLAKARPEYLAAMAAQQALASMRSSVYGGIFRGGPSTPGSAHGTVVQHVTNVNVKVQGNVWKTYDLARELQQVFVQNRMPLSLPRGR